MGAGGARGGGFALGLQAESRGFESRPRSRNFSDHEYTKLALNMPRVEYKVDRELLGDTNAPSVHWRSIC